MRTLAIETATEACSLALFEGNELLAQEHRLLGRGHAEHLVPMISALPDRGHADRILVSLGPGSFTGVRIGIAAARALGLAWSAEVLGYPTLALVAQIGRAESEFENLGVAMAGGHGEWFVQRFGPGGRMIGDHASLAPDLAANFLPDELVVGSRAEPLVDIRGHGRALTLLPDARFVAALPNDLLTANLAPIYGRAPDARLPQ